MPILLLLLIIGLSPLAAPAAEPATDTAAQRIVIQMQNLLNLEGRDVTSTFTLVQRKAGEADRVIKLKIFRRDTEKKFTLLFQYPDSEKGKGYYRNNDELYLYLPSTREFVYRNRKDDVGSTDVRTDLFGKLDLLRRYTPVYIGKDKIAQYECDVIELTALVPDVSFPVQKWFIRSSDHLPAKVENYSVSKTLLRTFYYIDYKEVTPKKYLFTKFMAQNNLEKDQRTLLSNEDIEAAAIPDYTFSKAFLEEQSR